MNALHWEQVLEAEGLAPLDDGGLISNRGNNESAAPEAAHAVDLWQAWANEIIAHVGFESMRQRTIWLLYARGATLTQIEHELGGSRRSITKQIARVREHSPTPPCPNPWRHARRDVSVSQADAKLLRLMPREEDDDMALKTVTYKRIVMKSGEDVFLPNLPNKAMAVLQNIEGEPHAGGIDVHCDGGRKVSVPWWRIRQADQAAPSEV